MHIEYIDDLLQPSVTIRYKGHSLTIDHLVIDTGAAHSLISSEYLPRKSKFTLKMATNLYAALESEETNTLSAS